MSEEGTKVTFGGIELNVRQVSSARIVEMSEKQARRLYIQQLNEISETMTPAEKTRFLLASAKEMTGSTDIKQMAAEWRGTHAGFKALVELALVEPVDENALTDAVMIATEDEVKYLAAVIKGSVEKKQEAPEPQ